MPGCVGSSQAVHGTPADRIREGKKSLCCVTTRRRKRRSLASLRRGLRPQAVRTLSLRMLGFDCGISATFGLPPRRLPLADQPQAYGGLAVALVPTTRLVLTSAPFAQARPPARSAPSGRTAMLSRTLASAHGRCHSHGKSSGRMLLHSPRALSETRMRRYHASLARCAGTRHRARRLSPGALNQTATPTLSGVALSPCAKTALKCCSVPRRCSRRVRCAPDP